MDYLQSLILEGAAIFGPVAHQLYDLWNGGGEKSQPHSQKQHLGNKPTRWAFKGVSHEKFLAFVLAFRLLVELYCDVYVFKILRPGTLTLSTFTYCDVYVMLRYVM